MLPSCQHQRLTIMSEKRRNDSVRQLQLPPTSPLAWNILRWVARVLSIVSIGIVLLFFIGEGMADGFSIASIASITWREWVAIVFFPFGVVVGMVVGWFRDGVGGSITAISLLLFYALDVLFTGTSPSGYYLYPWVFRVILRCRSRRYRSHISFASRHEVTFSARFVTPCLSLTLAFATVVLHKPPVHSQ